MRLTLRPWPVLVSLVLFAACLAGRAGEPAVSRERSIAVFPAGIEPQLRQRGAEVWGRYEMGVVAGADDDALAALAAEGIVPSFAVRDEAQWIYLFSHRPGVALPRAPGAQVEPLSSTTALFLWPGATRVVLPRTRPWGGFMALARLPLAPIEPHAADLAGAAGATGAARAPAAANPLVAQILAATDKATWFQDVKDLSGENPVDIGGQTWTISTRYTDAMFPTPQDNAHATEYLEDRALGWGFGSVRESYTSAESGCSQSKTWQNLIITIPGQVDYGEHQQVLFVNHYDSLSWSGSESFNYAPGADDAISGGSALLEAMRTFRNYAFRNTVKIAFFTGEEEGICGSGAYSRTHPSRDMWRVVNMDQTAFDGDQNGLMDVYNWDPTHSPGSVALGDAFVQANADYGNILDPAKIVRDTSKMCQTDHCPFWNVGVAAIAVCEDLHNNDICPCFDQSQTPTCHDTVTQDWNGRPMFNPDYSWPTEKAAIAVVAQLAQPLFACPPVAPALSATPRNNAVRLTWTAAQGVTDYAIERAATCAGPFQGIGTTQGTTFDDVAAANGATYAYRVRSCSTETSACVVAGAAAGPSVVYRAGSAAVAADSGDHDGVPDDCELVTVNLDLQNDGNVPLTGVRLAAVTSSDPAVRVASPVPLVAGPLAVGASTTVSFKFFLGRDGVQAACAEDLPFLVTVAADQAPAATRAFTLTAERTPKPGPLAYGFESDFSGWTVTSGSFTREAGGAAGSALGSLHSRNVNDDCNGVASPVVVPQANSVMTMAVNYAISGPNTDRALVRAVDRRTGVKTLLVPTGQPYNTTGNENLLCDNIGNLSGWTGNSTTWRTATFNLGALAGSEVRIEARYATDDFFLGSRGFWLDAVSISNAAQLDCDVPAACLALPPEVSPNGAAVPLTVKKSGTQYALRFSESAGATTYAVYAGTLAALAQGLYDHAPAPGLCGIVDAAPGDGAVDATAATLPANAYVLAVARSAAGESRYGVTSSGGEIPLGLTTCP